MNINEVKAQLGLTTLPLTRALDQQTKAPQPFLTYWDDATRKRVIIHDDTLKEINTGTANLAMNSRIKASKESGEEYTQIAIFVMADVEITL